MLRYAEAAIANGSKHDLFTKGTVDFKGFIAKEITPNGDFYITSYTKKVPRITADRFRLRVEGMVEHPCEFTLKELEAIQDKGEYVTLECIGNPVGGDAISNAYWEGVTLSKILHRAVPKPGVVKTAFFAEDGYSDSIPYNLSHSEDVFLAWRMNGQPLPPVHGYPLRVIVPGIFGMKNVKWLSRIELLTHDFKGYWEKQGWSDEAVIPIHSQVLMPMKGETIPLGHYVIGGIAYAGRHGIGRVQVSVDDERTWQDAELKPPLSKWAWVLWRYDWKPVAEGDVTIRVRGIDKAGKAQESGSLLGRVTGSFPNGAKGIHGVRVVVRRV
jgi:DMSO/TMAO reductase YedYZ molybdopterin-dependent catalytic subunit